LSTYRIPDNLQNVISQDLDINNCRKRWSRLPVQRYRCIFEKLVLMSKVTARAEPWWKQALGKFSVEGFSLLSTKFPSIRYAHEDIMSQTTLDIITLLRVRRSNLPASWFSRDTPDDASVARFYKLARTILNRRVSDHFRRHFSRWAESLDDLPKAREPVSPDKGMDVGLDLKRLLNIVFSLVNTLPSEDRDLLQRIALDEVVSPMDEKERQRLHRLRVMLISKLRAQLGEDPIVLLRMF